MRFILNYLPLAILCSLSWAAPAQHLPEEFNDQLFLNRFDFPTALVFDEAGRMYVTEKAGRVWVVDTNRQVLPEPLIDISEEVSDWKDHGLMSMALDRNFRSNGYFYLLYALDLHHYDHYGTPQYNPDTSVINFPTIGRVARYQADPATGFSRALPESRKILLGETIDNGIPILYEFHGLGHIAMSEDGTLLLSCGDAAGPDEFGGDSSNETVQRALARGVITPDQDIGSYRSMYLGSYSGKLLRIDAETGDGLPSNPFYDPEAPRSPRSRTWAWGLRNPYRFTIRPHSAGHFPEEGRPGILFVGDVGGGGWEELNVVQFGGQNFGWPILEGIGLHWPYALEDAPLNRLAPNPWHDDGCGQPFFDFKELFVSLQRDSTPAPTHPCHPDLPIEDYVIGYPPAIQWTNSRWNPPVRAWIPFFNDSGHLNGAELGSGQTAVEGENFAGYSALSGLFYEGEHFPEAYRGKFFNVDFDNLIQVMDFDEEHRLQSVAPFHTYAKDIIHLAASPRDGKLYYINLQGQIRQISFGGRPAPIADLGPAQHFGPSPLPIEFDASASQSFAGPIVSYEWDFGDGHTSTERQPAHTFTAESGQLASYSVTLTVTDSLGATASAQALVSLNNSPPQVEISSFRDGDRYPIDQGTTLLRLAATVHDAEHGDEELFYQWRTFLHHNDHFHPDAPIFEPESFTLLSPLGCGEEEYWYRIELTVTDPGGLSATRTQSVYPHCGPPVVLWSELRAKTLEQKVRLEWQTSREDSIAYYEIQRGGDVFNFRSLGQLRPKTSGSGHTYGFDDRAPLHGRNVYRIKAVHRNGAFAYTNLAEAAYPRALPFRLFPNPAGAHFRIEANAKLSGAPIRLELFNELGALVLAQSWESAPGQSFAAEVPTASLPHGVYFFRLWDGEEAQSGRLLIVR
jgi:glucose/arabinose dehydrogenase